MDYFAASSAPTLISSLSEHLDRWRQTTSSATGGLMAVWQRNMQVYYAGLLVGDSGSALGFGGVQGELVEVSSNQARSLTRQFLALVTKSRLEFEATALTTETGVLADTRLANSLARHIVEQQHLNLLGDRLAETAALAGTAYLKTAWRTDRGPRYGKDHAGGLHMTVHHPLDVVFDTSREHAHERDWVMVRTVQNRHDLAAQFPALAGAIANLPAPERDDLFLSGQQPSDDLCFVYEFYHRATASLEAGRLVVFGDAKTVFFDGENPYVDQDGQAFIPIAECKPEPVLGTPWGYSFFNDLVPLQEMLDASLSTAASNVSAYGLGTMLNPEGNGLKVTDIGGLQFLNYKPASASGGGKPEPLQLPSTPSEVYRFSETLKANMQELSNINSTLRGAPPSNVTSGTMAATLSANAIEFAAPFAKAYHMCLEQAMFHALLCYKCFATVPQVLAIAGQGTASKAAVVRNFVGADIGNLARVSLKTRSALSSTAAGISDIGEKLLKAGLIRSPQQYLELIETGNIQSLYETEQSENDLINAENDDLREGTSVRAMASDIHPQHVVQHKQVVNDPELRRLAARYVEGGQNSEAVLKAYRVMRAATEHILEHVRLQGETDPMLLAMASTGQAPQTQGE